MLKGGTPYGDDRSTNLTGFAKETYGVCNWLDGEGLHYQGTAEQLIQQAIEMLNIEDKAERVLSSIDPADCDCDTAKVKRRYEYQLRPGWPSGFKQQNGAAKILKGFEDQSPPPASFQALIQLLPDCWS